MIKYSFESRFYQGPVVDKPVVDKPVVDTPVVDTPVVDKPVVDKPVVDTVFCGTLRSGEVVPHPMVKKLSKKHTKRSDLDARPAFRGLPGAKLIAGGPGRVWTGDPQKNTEKNKHQGFWGLGGRGEGPVPYRSL